MNVFFRIRCFNCKNRYDQIDPRKKLESSLEYLLNQTVCGACGSTDISIEASLPDRGINNGIRFEADEPEACEPEMNMNGAYPPTPGHQDDCCCVHCGG